jgi:hypothetical protein
MFHSFFQGEQLRLGQNPIFVPPFGHQYVAQNRSNLEALSSMDEMGGSYFIISVLEGLSKYIYIILQNHHETINKNIRNPSNEASADQPSGALWLSAANFSRGGESQLLSLQPG